MEPEDTAKRGRRSHTIHKFCRVSDWSRGDTQPLRLHVAALPKGVGARGASYRRKILDLKELEDL